MHPFRAYKSPLYKVFAGAAFFIALLMMCGGFSLFGTDARGALAMLAIAGVAAVAGYLTLRFVAKNKGRTVTLCENGFIEIRPGALNIVAWPEIDEAYQRLLEIIVEGGRPVVLCTYAIVTNDKRSFEFNDNLDDHVALGDAIHRAVARVKLPNALTRFDRGEPLEFGPLSVSQMGLTQKGEFISWNEIEGVEVEGGYVDISKKGKWLRWGSAEVAEIPNPRLFLDVVRRVLGGKS